MKSYKNEKQLRKALTKAIGSEKIEIWKGDCFRVDGLVYNLTEYGNTGGFTPKEGDYDYAYFTNKRTGNKIVIHYDCPSTKRDGTKTPFWFYKMELYGIQF